MHGVLRDITSLDPHLMRLLLGSVLSIVFSAPVYAATATSMQIADDDMRLDGWSVIDKHNPVTLFDSSFVNTEALLVVGSAQVWSAVYRTTPVWDPAAEGAIKTVSLTADFFIDRNERFAPVLVQDGNAYAPAGVPPYFIEPQAFNTPQGLSWSSLSIDLFDRHEIGSGPALPDFTAGAPAIHFGIAVRRDSGGVRPRFGRIDFRIDGILPDPGDYNGDGLVDVGDYHTIDCLRLPRNRWPQSHPHCYCSQLPALACNYLAAR